MQPESTLENKLGDVNIGDVVLLENSSLSVVGYVRRKSPQAVTLSHIDPNSSIQGQRVIWSGYAHWRGLWDKDRDYVLKKFESFAVLRGAEASLASAVSEKETNPEEDVYSKVRVGEVLFLGSEEINAAGFVLYKGNGSVVLSHVDPNSLVQGGKITELGYASGPLHDGQLGFNSSKFNWFSILKELKPHSSNPR